PQNHNLKPHTEKKEKKPVLTKKKNATLKQKIKILDWHHKNKSSQSKISSYWNDKYPNLKLMQPQILDWLKMEDELQKQYAEALARRQTGNAKREKLTKNPEVNKMLEL
ncbi:hypothetical protein C0995_012340, partial [Termitomyces sp. Mi166